MNTWLLAYLVGVAVTGVLMFLSVRKEGVLSVGDLLTSIIACTLSWATILVLVMIMVPYSFEIKLWERNEK